MNDTIIIIPARYGSTRLPGKVLIDINGSPMLKYVWKAAKKVGGVDCIIATDSRNVFDAARSFGAEVIMTGEDIKSGSDRALSAINALGKEYEFVINLQADEPLITEDEIILLKQAITEDKEADIATLIVRVNESDAKSPNNVKVVFDNRGYALYFSRSIIPFYRNADSDKIFYKHIGVYAYKYHALEKFSALSQSALERAEKLEQLRALENAMKIKVVECGYNFPGVDTEEDLEIVKSIIKRRGNA